MQIKKDNSDKKADDLPVKNIGCGTGDLLDHRVGSYIFSKTKGICLIEKNSESPQKIADYARIVEISSNLFTNEENYVLEYYRASTKDFATMRIEGDMLMSNKVEQLVKFGVDINMSNKRNVLTALTQSRRKAKNYFVYDAYGWKSVKDEPVFLHTNVISKSGINKQFSQSDSARLDLGPAGSYESWLSMYQTYVKGNTPLEFAVVLGASSAVLSHMNNNYPDLKTLIVHMNGQSSQGKTTAAMLALSVGGNPTSHGLLKSWNSTQNALMSHLNGLNGIATCFDELSQTRSTNLTSLLYSLAEGKQKDRSTKEGALMETAHWCTTILSTGELSIFNRLDKNLGLRVRILELAQVQWTASASQSEEIKKSASTNYGHLLPKFVEKLLSMGLPSIDREFEEQRQILLEKMTDSPTTERISMKLAVIMATASLLEKMNLLELNVEAIRGFLLENDQANFDDRDHSTKAMDDVLQYLVGQQSKLMRDNQSRIPHEVIGLLSNKGDVDGKQTMVISIMKAHFEPMLTELKYQDTKVILKDWNQKGLLVTESGRQTIRMNLDVDGSGKKKVPLYSFLVPEEYQNLFMETPNYEVMGETPYFPNSTKTAAMMAELLDMGSEIE